MLIARNIFSFGGAFFLTLLSFFSIFKPLRAIGYSPEACRGNPSISDKVIVPPNSAMNPEKGE
jgi:hypothetical protein